ncbi:DHA2 family efflux MFS transporter permease subunit [Ktedonobacter racemifer]|uniref:Drug resistance transporter, EmrB/QacA subfamily n=1 Tax=Ktedonobacter racemifer DSM 44963 TaxID=485913 RepID=D6TWC9_KTERA|nr:DHA2 family efflux MFS transporter permease subunit [Ktedonobacter racemifer]EFH84512.1 drug resistance transporter, EmrB/QacA subfamily [Ktedonobacter racemifer DSM 44963]
MRLNYRWQATIVLVLGLFMAVLDNTIVSVALPQIQKAFNTSFDTVTWVSTGYFLSQAAVIPIIGYLSDRLGTKVVYLTALGLFTVGSALCVFAPNEELLIVFRVIQGLGGGAMMPTAFTLIYRLFGPTERGPVTATVGIPVFLAPAFGPTIGGYLTTTFDWSAIFTINLPIGLIAIVLGLFILHNRAQERAAAGEEHASQGQRVDIAGLLLSMLGFTTLVYGITEAGTRGWVDPIVISLMAAGGVILIVFAIVELFIASDPVINLRLFAQYTFAISNLLLWVVSAVLFGSLFLLPFFFENVQGNTPLTAGLWLMAQGIATAIGMVFGGQLYNRVGPRPLAFVGLILLAVGTYGLTQLDVSTSGGALQGWLILRGLGLGLTNTSLQTVALSAVSNKAMARASSLLNVMRMVFSAVGVAVLTTYLSQQATSYAITAKQGVQAIPPSGIAMTCAATVGAHAEALKNCVTQHVTVMGLNDTFWLVLIGCVICIFIALVLGRDPALEAAKRARAHGEVVQAEVPVAIGE